MLREFDSPHEWRLSKLNTSQLIAIRCLRNIQGGSRPAIVECSDGNLYIIKTTANPRGPTILVNEYIGGMLCVALGFNIPTPSLIEISDDLISKTPALCSHLGIDSRHSTAGIQYGMRFIGDASGMRAAVQYVPSRRIDNQTDFLGLYLFDLWANHHKRRQRSFVPDPNTSRHNAVFIDNGLLFGGPEWSFFNEHRQTSYRSQDRLHFAWSSDDAECWIEHFRRTIPLVLRRTIADIPFEWVSSPLSYLEGILIDRLDHLKELVDRCHLGVMGWDEMKTLSRTASRRRGYELLGNSGEHPLVVTGAIA